jgi:hypothetical protein
MRRFTWLALDFMAGMLAKSRLILIVTVAAVLALIWVDRHLRGGM